MEAIWEFKTQIQAKYINKYKYNTVQYWTLFKNIIYNFCVT